MKSALLFYRKLISELREMGFEINPYNSWSMCCKQDGEWNANDNQIACGWPDDQSPWLGWDHKGCARNKGHLRGEPGWDCWNHAPLFRNDFWLFLYKRSKDQHVGLPKKGYKEIPGRDYGVCATSESDYLLRCVMTGGSWTRRWRRHSITWCTSSSLQQIECGAISKGQFCSSLFVWKLQTKMIGAK